MISIIKLTSGEEIIAEFETDDIQSLESFNAIYPMIILGDVDGSMRLRSLTLISKDTMIVFPQKHVMTHYLPSAAMEEYYVSAREYSATHTRKSVDTQITSAAEDFKSATMVEYSLDEDTLIFSKTTFH